MTKLERIVDSQCFEIPHVEMLDVVKNVGKASLKTIEVYGNTYIDECTIYGTSNRFNRSSEFPLSRKELLDISNILTREGNIYNCSLERVMDGSVDHHWKLVISLISDEDVEKELARLGRL